MEEFFCHVCAMLLPPETLPETEIDDEVIPQFLLSSTKYIDIYAGNVTSGENAKRGSAMLSVFKRYFSTKSKSGRGIGTYSMKLFGERYLGGKVGFYCSEGVTVFILIYQFL